MAGAQANVLAYMRFPKAHRTQIHTTNPLEHLNAEAKRRTDVVGIFPNGAAVQTVIDSGEWYVGSKDRAAQIVEEVVKITRSWRERAITLQLARVDIETTVAAFAATETWHRKN